MLGDLALRSKPQQRVVTSGCWLHSVSSTVGGACRFPLFHPRLYWLLSCELEELNLVYRYWNYLLCSWRGVLKRAATLLGLDTLEWHPLDHFVNISTKVLFDPSMWFVKNSKQANCMNHLHTLESTCLSEFGLSAIGAETYKKFLSSVRMFACAAP